MSDTRAILFLPGVFLRDCPSNDDPSSEVEVVLSSDEELDSIATDITQLTYDVRKPAIKKYDSIPNQFIKKETWPQQTNLLCWYCDCSFTTMPWPIITGCSKTLVSEDSDIADISDTVLLNSHSAFNEILIMDTHGNFCLPGCAMAYIENVNDPAIINKYECKRLLLTLIEIMTKQHVSYVPLSEPKTTMQKYCGSHGKTEEKYVEENQQKQLKYTSAIEKSTLSSVIVSHPKKQK